MYEPCQGRSGYQADGTIRVRGARPGNGEDMTDLNGKVALLTGAGGGIGGALADALYAQGAFLILHSDDAAALAARVRDAGWDEARFELSGHDVRDSAAVEGAVGRGITRFGRIDFLINIAGINRFGGILTCTEEEWDAVASTNVKGYFLTARAIVPHMKEAGSGAIINMSSVWGVRGNPRMMAYSASKHAVEGFTKSLREEVAPWGIKVSSLVVGIVDTAFRDAMRDHVRFSDEQCQRMLTPQDVVDSLLYVLRSSPRALPSSITLEAWLIQ